MATSKQSQAAKRPVSEPEPSGKPSRSPLSRWLSAVDRDSSRPAVVLLVLAVAVAWVGVSIAAAFPTRWETVFQTLVAALTLAMVFVIQHTQARHQQATQRKLDEILRALPHADNSLMTLEHASDEELRATGHEHRRIRRAALDDQAAASE
jgi:low affinity Fe/Cu permease